MPKLYICQVFSKGGGDEDYEPMFTVGSLNKEEIEKTHTLLKSLVLNTEDFEYRGIKEVEFIGYKEDSIRNLISTQYPEMMEDPYN